MNVRLFILGLPGSGKGTISKLLLDHFSGQEIRYYNVGAILREQAEQDKHIKDTHASGGLVSSDRVLGIFNDALNQSQFIADGSPRRPEEATYVLNDERWKTNPGYLIHLNIAPELAKERLLARGRFDDNEEIINKRLKDFEWYTTQSIKKFQDAGKVISVDASASQENVVAAIVRALKMLEGQV